MSVDTQATEANTPPIAEASAPSWSAVKDAGVAADKGHRRRMEVRYTLLYLIKSGPNIH